MQDSNTTSVDSPITYTKYMHKFLHKINYPLVTALVCLCIYYLFFILLLEKKDRDITTFIHAGSVFVNETQLSRRIAVLPNSHGYDGQFYYSLSLNPFTNSRINDGIMLDNPHYRQQRIMYPFIAWLFSFNRIIIPYILVGLNLFFITIIGFYGGIIAQKFHKHALWGIIFVVWPGFLFTFSRNLTEIVAIAFLLAGITHLFYKQYIVSGLLLACAVLSKETTLIVPISICIANIFQIKKSYNKLVWYTALFPLAVYQTWHIWLSQKWTDAWTIEIHNNVGIPFIGLLDFINKIPTLPKMLQISSVIEIICIAFFVFFAYISIQKNNISLFLKISLLFYSALVLSLTKTVWVEDIAFMRASTELFIIGILLIIQVNWHVYKYIFPMGIIVWLYMVIDILKLR